MVSYDIPEWILPILRDVPDIILDPFPHLVLPAPFTEYCLTPFLKSDVLYLPEIVNHPASKTLAIRGGDFTDEAAATWIASRLDEARGCFPLQVIRRVDSLSSENPPLLAICTIGPERYRPYLPIEAEDEARKANLLRPAEERQYQFVLLCRPDLRGKGLNTAAASINFKVCPWIHNRPGQLSGGWLVGNEASRKVQTRLGMVPLAKRLDMHNGHNAIMAIWAGAGPISKADSIWAPMLDFEPGEEGPYATQLVVE